MDVTQAHAQAGYCYLKLGDHTRARTHLRHGLRLQDATYSREGALRQVPLATTYIRQDRPDLDQPSPTAAWPSTRSPARSTRPGAWATSTG
jgi:hypothetical protein